MMRDIAHQRGRPIGARSECSPSRTQRKGLMLLLVIVCLIVLTTIIGAMVRQMGISNRQVRLRERSAQSTWLAESAIQRAAFRLRQDAGYRGETWDIPGSETGHRHDARVEIEVKPLGKNDDLASDEGGGAAEDGNNAANKENDTVAAGQFTISVAATYPLKSDYRSTVRKQITISKPQTISNEDSDTGATP